MQSRLGLLLLLLSILALFFVTKPQIATFSENTLEAKKVSVELTSYQNRVKQLDDIKQQGPAITALLDRYYLAMPKTAQIPESLVMMESMIGQSGVSLNSFAVGVPTASEVPVSLSFSGSLTNVKDMLNVLYKNIRTVNIHNQTMTADPAGNVVISLQLGLAYQGN